MKHLAVMGSKNSGKTTLATHLIKRFVDDGFRVAAVKNIHHEFTIDTEGKDTWKMARAGAAVVSSVSPNETAVIFRDVAGPSSRLELLAKIFSDENIDIVVYEGFHHVFGRSPHVYKIIALKNPEEASMLLDLSDPVVAIFRRDRFEISDSKAPVFGPEMNDEFFLYVKRRMGLS